MTPGARLAAAIELLDAVIAAAREGGAAADTLIARYFATRRYAGSKDRRAVRELVYEAIRRFGEPPATGRAAMVGLAEIEPGVAAMFDGSAHAPPDIGPDEPRAVESRVPGWLGRRLADSGLDPVDIGERDHRGASRCGRLAETANGFIDQLAHRAAVLRSGIAPRREIASDQRVRSRAAFARGGDDGIEQLDRRRQACTRRHRVG